MLVNTIPGTTYKLPSPFDLMHAGVSVTSRDWLARTYGLDAVLAWEAADCPEWNEPLPMPIDQGVMRRGWAKRCKV